MRGTLGVCGLVLATTLVAGCGSNDKSEAKSPASDNPSSSASSSASSAAPSPSAPGWTAAGAPFMKPSIKIKEQPNYVNTIDYAPDGASFASGDADGNVRLWDSRGQRAEEPRWPQGRGERRGLLPGRHPPRDRRRRQDRTHLERRLRRGHGP